MGQSKGDHSGHIQRKEHDYNNLHFMKCDEHWHSINRSSNRYMHTNNILCTWLLCNDILSKREVHVHTTHNWRLWRWHFLRKGRLVAFRALTYFTDKFWTLMICTYRQSMSVYLSSMLFFLNIFFYKSQVSRSRADYFVSDHLNRFVHLILLVI